VTLTPDEADELLRVNHHQDMLQRVWKEGSFRQIRQLDSPEEQFALTYTHAAKRLHSLPKQRPYKTPVSYRTP